MNAKLVIGVIQSIEPDPKNPGQGFIQTSIQPQWLVNGVSKPCTDRAQVIAALKHALDAAIGEVDFDPPSSIVRPNMELVPGAPH